MQEMHEKFHSTIIQSAPKAGRVAPLYFGLGAIEGLFTILYLLILPSDQKNSFMWGYSLQRLTMVFGSLLLTTGMGYLGVVFWRNQGRGQQVLQRILSRSRLYYSIILLAGVGLYIGWIGIFLPLYRFGGYAAYFERIRPLLIWLALIFIQTLIPLLMLRFGFNWQRLGDYIKQHLALIPLGVTLGLMVLTGIWVALTKSGITPDKKFWGNIGTPILNLQIFLLLGVGLILLCFIMYWNSRRQKNNAATNPKWLIYIDILVCFLLWALATFLWVREPVIHSYFLTDPQAPNYEPYPFSDARYYDSYGQYLLIGEKMGGGKFATRPWYIFFLAMINAIAGPGYDQVIALQVAALALFPVFLYLLGKSLNSRILGIMVGLLAIFREVNAIRSTPFIQVSHSKLMLADFPTAAGVALFTLLVVIWLKDPEHKPLMPMIVGGVFGILMMVRFHVVTLLPLALLAGLLVLWRRFGNWIRSSVLLVFTMMIFVLPWMYRNYNVLGRFILEGPQIKSILNQRYKPTPTPRPTLLATVTPTNMPVDLTASVDDANGGSILPVNPVAGLTAPTAVSGVAVTPEAIFSPTTTPAPKLKTEREITTYAFQLFFSENVQAVSFVSNHFLHNLLLAVRELPTSLIYDDLNHVLLNFPADSDNWDGKLKPAEAILMTINLLLIALGISVTWKKWKIVGIIPLFMCAGYFMSSALTRVSGWRYLLPVDWVIYFYFVIGLLEILRWFAVLLGAKLGEDTHFETKLMDNPKGSFPIRQAAFIITGFFLLGSVIPAAELLIPERYPIMSKEEVLTTFMERLPAEQPGLDVNVLQQIVSADVGDAVNGRLLYPVYYEEGQGAPGADSQIFRSKPYARLLLTVIGPRTATVVMPLEEPPAAIPSTSDILVVGCKEQGAFQAYAIMVMGETTTVYTRSSNFPLECISQVNP